MIDTIGLWLGIGFWALWLAYMAFAIIGMEIDTFVRWQHLKRISPLPRYRAASRPLVPDLRRGRLGRLGRLRLLPVFRRSGRGAEQ